MYHHPRLGEERWVDVYVAPVLEYPESVVVLLQVRSMADTLDKQLTHRGAARTVTGLASMLAMKSRTRFSGIRGAAQLLEANGDEEDRTLTRLITDETDRIVRLVDRMEVFSDERPIERDPVNVHAVLEHVKNVAPFWICPECKNHRTIRPLTAPPCWGTGISWCRFF